MGLNDLVLAAAVGAVLLAVSATLAALAQRRRSDARVAAAAR